MIFVFLLVSEMTVLISSLGLIEQPPLQCSQKDLSCSVQISKPGCSNEGWVKPRYDAPGMHPMVDIQVKSRADEWKDTVPVLFITLIQHSDGSLYSLQGMEFQLLEIATNTSLCVSYIFNNRLPWVSRLDHQPWSFSLDRIVVDPGLTYQVSVSNLPKPDVGRRAEVINITVPGCTDPDFKSFKVCLENGSLWDPNISWSVLDNWRTGGVIAVMFNTARFSDTYRVFVLHADLHSDLSQTVSKDNRTSVMVNFSLDTRPFKHCGLVIGIEPFFIRCMNNCLTFQQRANICPSIIPSTNRHCIVWILLCLTALVICKLVATIKLRALDEATSFSSPNTTAKSDVDIVPVQKRSKVLIIYSQDHPLYTQIVLRLCSFLRSKGGTEVTLDLLDSAWLSTIGCIQWLDMQRERLSGSSDKVLILCSPGVRAKWNAMCEGRRVVTKLDARSPMGDMLTPALSLIVPDFVGAPSFCKYLVAYFEDVCSERDVPAPFNVAVKYQLMRHFEELFFRLLGEEKYEPGRIKLVSGLGPDDYDTCASGKALRDAISEFQAYQQVNPNWFEMELVNIDEEESLFEQEDCVDITAHCALQNELQLLY